MTKNIRSYEELSAPSDTPEGEPHELFPCEVGEPLPIISQIVVRRRDERGEWLSASRMFSPQELESLAVFSERFGGGAYELQARHAGRLTKRASFKVAGPPKPLFDDVSRETVAQGAESAPRPVAVAPSSDGGMVGFFQLMMQMQQNFTQMLHQQNLALMQQNAAQMLEAKQDSRNMMTLLSKQAENDKSTMAMFFGKLSENQAKASPGGGVMETLLQGMELGADLAGKKGGGDEGNGTVNALIGLAGQMMAAKAAETAAATVAPSAPPPAMGSGVVEPSHGTNSAS